jgi:GTP cyclohydrolase IA
MSALAQAEAAVLTLLDFIGEDSGREGLADTPSRVARSWQELCCGYAQDPVAILRSAMFTDAELDELVVAGPFPFASMCEHHLLPFVGTAVIAYLPEAGRVTGLSKLPRALGALSARLQVQERLTAQMADALRLALDPLGWGVVLRAEHLCASVRGVRTRTPFTTSVMRGALRSNPAARAEMLALVG